MEYLTVKYDFYRGLVIRNLKTYVFSMHSGLVCMLCAFCVSLSLRSLRETFGCKIEKNPKNLIAQDLNLVEQHQSTAKIPY
jgi:hypothetical protein